MQALRPPFGPHHLAPAVLATDAFLRATVRWSVSDPHGNLERARAGIPAIFACRHGQLWPLLWAVRHCGVSIVVSRSSDGELLSRVLGPLGFGLVRGSTSRDGLAAARGVMRVLRNGGSVGLAVDGPRGPRGKVQDGMLRLAQRAQVPLVPMCWTGHRAWEAPGSWDRFQIPIPGQKLEIAVSQPVMVESGPQGLAVAGDAVAAALGGWREDGPLHPEARPDWAASMVDGS